ATREWGTATESERLTRVPPGAATGGSGCSPAIPGVRRRFRLSAGDSACPPAIPAVRRRFRVFAADPGPRPLTGGGRASRPVGAVLRLLYMLRGAVGSTREPCTNPRPG